MSQNLVNLFSSVVDASQCLIAQEDVRRNIGMSTTSQSALKQYRRSSHNVASGAQMNRVIICARAPDLDPNGLFMAKLEIQ